MYIGGGSKKNWRGVLSPSISTVDWLQKPFQKSREMQKIIAMLEKNMSFHANISYTPFDQSSPRPSEESVLNCQRQTHIQTDLKKTKII